MKSTFKIGRIKVSGEAVNYLSSRTSEDKMEVVSDKSPLYVELNDIEVCYEDFTASDVITIGKEVGSMVFGAVKENIAMEMQQREQRREVNRRSQQSRRDKRISRMGRLSDELSKQMGGSF